MIVYVIIALVFTFFCGALWGYKWGWMDAPRNDVVIRPHLPDHTHTRSFYEYTIIPDRSESGHF